MNPRRKDKRPGAKPVNTNNSLNEKSAVPPSTNSGITRIITASQQFSGPLPPPEILLKYNDVVPNGAERIIVMAEKQQNHRIYLEKFVIEQDAKRANLGLILGFILALMLGGGGVWVVLMGQNIAGLTLIFVPLATLAGIFINTQKVRKEEREASKQTVTEKSAVQKK